IVTAPTDTLVDAECHEEASNAPRSQRDACNGSAPSGSDARSPAAARIMPAAGPAAGDRSVQSPPRWDTFARARVIANRGNDHLFHPQADPDRPDLHRDHAARLRGDAGRARRADRADAER